MSTHRIRPDAGRDKGDGTRGENGRRLCRLCGVEVPPRRRTFCGPGCVHEFKLQTNHGYVRRHVLKRDRARCAVCGVIDPEWQADHILPVCEGGGGCGLDGYRTLCLLHHREATAALARRRAEERRRQKQEAKMAMSSEATATGEPR